MSEQDAFLGRIVEGVEPGRACDLEGARTILGELWDELGRPFPPTTTGTASAPR